jgi:hypothetical protein
MHSMIFAAPKAPQTEESRMISVTAKVTQTMKEYVVFRAKQEGISESEFVLRLLYGDSLRQGCQYQPVSDKDPAIPHLQHLGSQIQEVIKDGVIDMIERTLLTRLTVGSANALVNSERTA